MQSLCFSLPLRSEHFVLSTQSRFRNTIRCSLVMWKTKCHKENKIWGNAVSFPVHVATRYGIVSRQWQRRAVVLCSNFKKVFFKEPACDREMTSGVPVPLLDGRQKSEMRSYTVINTQSSGKRVSSHVDLLGNNLPTHMRWRDCFHPKLTHWPNFIRS